MLTKSSRFPGEPGFPASVPTPEVALEILGAIQDLRFGSVEVVVHNGKVVQIERREKIRPAGAGREEA